MSDSLGKLPIVALTALRSRSARSSKVWQLLTNAFLSGFLVEIYCAPLTSSVNFSDSMVSVSPTSSVEGFLRVLLTPNAPQGSENETRDLLGGIEENGDSPTRSHKFAFEENG